MIGMLAGGLGLWLVRAVYFRVRQREGLGLGDVKLAAVAGAWIGWQSLSDVILLAAALALSLAIALGLMRGKELSAAARIPFGCFLAPSIWLVWALGALGSVPDATASSTGVRAPSARRGRPFHAFQP